MPTAPSVTERNEDSPNATRQERPAPSAVTIYTDGACRGNPGPGGYAAILLYGTHRKEISGGYRRTTNNRMEIFRLIAALEALTRPCKAHVHADSKYLLNACTKGWLRRWKANGWQTTGRKDVQNRDLWERLDPLLSRHDIEFKWVKGHASSAENNRCDALAVAASRAPHLPPDSPYESESA